MQPFRLKMLEITKQHERYKIALEKIVNFSKSNAPYANLADCIQIAYEALERK